MNKRRKKKDEEEEDKRKDKVDYETHPFIYIQANPPTNNKKLLFSSKPLVNLIYKYKERYTLYGFELEGEGHSLWLDDLLQGLLTTANLTETAAGGNWSQPGSATAWNMSKKEIKTFRKVLRTAILMSVRNFLSME